MAEKKGGSQADNPLKNKGGDKKIPFSKDAKAKGADYTGPHSKASYQGDNPLKHK